MYSLEDENKRDVGLSFQLLWMVNVGSHLILWPPIEVMKEQINLAPRIRFSFNYVIHCGCEPFLCLLQLLNMINTLALLTVLDKVNRLHRPPSLQHNQHLKWQFFYHLLCAPGVVIKQPSLSPLCHLLQLWHRLLSRIEFQLDFS